MNFPQWLQLTFIVLKLTGFIDWSWWLVMTPAIVLFVFCVAEGTIDALKEHRIIK